MSKPVDPANLAKNGSEHGEQVAYFAWCSQHFNEYPELKFVFAIPNGGQRNKVTGANLRAEGVKPGVLDIFLPIPRVTCHGLFIELKRIKTETQSAGKLTPEQEYWIFNLRNQGYGAICCWGWKEAADVTIKYLNWK